MGICVTLSSTLVLKVVLMLSESIKGRHHQLFFDNFFTSITLLDKLLAVTAVVPYRKKFPSELCGRQRSSPRSQSVFRQSGNIVGTAWKDNNVVNVASTCADLRELTTVKMEAELMLITPFA